MYFNFNRAYENRAFNQTVKATKLQMQATKQEKSVNNMTVYFRHLTVNFNLYIGIKQANMTIKTDFIKFIRQKNLNLDLRLRFIQI